MTKLSPAIIVAALLVYSDAVQAQVKDTYQDQSNALTTIVVKEDSASDMAILQQQFDLDEIGMHQVIRITTRPQITPKPEEVKIENPALQEEHKMIANAEPVTTSDEAPVSTAPSAIQPEQVAEEVVEKSGSDLPVSPKVGAVTQKSQRSASSSSGYSKRNKSSQKNLNVFKKRFKKDKRKRSPRKNKRNNRCYKF
jgi:hypothetical protein